MSISSGYKAVVNLYDFGFRDPIHINRGLMKMAEKGKMPTYDVVVNVGKKGKDEKAIWHKIGSAWLNDKNISVSLNSLPLDRQIYLFPVTKKEDR